VVEPSGECLQGEDAGLAESNGSLPPGDDLEGHLRVLPVHQELQAQSLVTSMGEIYFLKLCIFIH